MNKLILSSSPHIRDNSSTVSLMRDVLIGLAPAAIASIAIFGIKALLLLVVTVASSVLFELLYQSMMKQPVRVHDLSAAVTGLLLGLSLPADLPVWMAIIGSFVSIVIVKQLFGGLGKNFVNPAIVGRIVLMLSFGDAMSGDYPIAFRAVDGITGATALSGGWYGSNMDLLLGNRAGALGEAFAIGLIIGGLYLIIRKVITPSIPLSFLGTIAIMAFLLGKDPVFHLLAGGALIGAFFMATDYVTSPMTEKGKIIYGIGCGLITMIIRVFGNYPEGVSFSILLMNILTPHIDNLTRVKPLGGVVTND